jgi:hypothetical protein
LMKILKTATVMLHYLFVSFNNLAECLDPLSIKKNYMTTY